MPPRMRVPSRERSRSRDSPPCPLLHARPPRARARSRSRGAPTPERAPRPPQGAARLAAREVHQQIDELSEWLQAQQEQLNHIVGWIRRLNSRISVLEHAVFGESEPEPTSDRSPG